MASKTAVVMLNLGGPRKAEEVKDFLVRMFSDRTFITLPSGVGPMIAKLRSKAKQKEYEAIGYSPLVYWNDLQGSAMTQVLNSSLPQFAPFQHYLAFRYSEPLAGKAIKRALDDGAERLILFTQYPHYSCVSTGNSLIDAISAVPEEHTSKVSVIQSWATHPSYIAAWKQIIQEELGKFEGGGQDVQLVFSAHSIPSVVAWTGDMYPYEIGSTVAAIMQSFSNPYSLTWQSKVGFQTWFQPATHKSLLTLAQQGVKKVLLIPIAFTSDHIETLYELDREVVPEVRKAGMTGLVRCAAPNAHPAFTKALADIVTDHVHGKPKRSLHQCVHCRFPEECSKLRRIQTSFAGR